MTNTSQSCRQLLFDSAGSQAFSPARKRTFSSRTTLPASTVDTIDPVAQQWHVAPQQLTEPGPQPAAVKTASSGWPSVGRPRCDISITAAPACECRLYARQCGTNSSVAGYNAAVADRNVQVLSRINTRLPAELEVEHLDYGHCSRSRIRRYERRLRYPACGSKNPIRCRTTNTP